jgi:lipopolysaccharide transport system ATP-binding protein
LGLGVKMAEIIFEKASIDFPLLNNQSRLITSRILKVSSGGRLDADAGGRVLVHALKDINLKLQDGDRLGVIGGNGAGKSTFLRTLVGVYKPTSGAVKVSGSIGSLIDVSLGINPEATGRQNILIRGALLGMGKKSMEEKMDEIIAFSELESFIDLPVRTYSTGMQMRLAFSVSTIVRPEILVMDEWLSVGDESFVEKAEARMGSMIDSAKILVVASHSKSLLEKLVTQVLWLESGKVRKLGPASEVLGEYFSS